MGCVITEMGRFDTYKGGVGNKSLINQICIKTMSAKGGCMLMKLMKQKNKKYCFLLCEYMGPTSF
jgi:hypothetical protein